MLNNLVENALRHTPAGGVVNVRAARRGEGVEINVIDTGPGISETDRARVFDRFYRGADDLNAVAGSGLGLSIVKAIVDRHGGRIGLHQPDEGTGLEVRVAL
jgi:signal transduction histidine kinase